MCYVVLERPEHGGPRRTSIGPYSATVGPIPTKPATPIHRSRPRYGSAAISRPGTHHRSADFMHNPKSCPGKTWALSLARA